MIDDKVVARVNERAKGAVTEDDLVINDDNRFNEPSIGKSPINGADMAFVNLIANGYSLTEAYKMTFPMKCINLSDANISSRAYNLATKPKIIKARHKVEAHFGALAEEAGLWKREDSLKHLRKLINTAEIEHDRIALGQDLELELIQAELDDVNKDLDELVSNNGDSKDIRALEKKRLSIMQRLSKTLKTKGLGQNTVKAITESVKEINAMQGYDGDTVDIGRAINIITLNDDEEVYE